MAAAITVLGLINFYIVGKLSAVESEIFFLGLSSDFWTGFAWSAMTTLMVIGIIRMIIGKNKV